MLFLLQVLPLTNSKMLNQDKHYWLRNLIEDAVYFAEVLQAANELSLFK